jgi:serine/threonine-protein kinase
VTQALPTSDDLPKRGEIIAGKYQVDEVLGTGGMGVVVAARHVALRQRVAVKFLLPAALRLPEASPRFLREARAAVAIQSEHVARVIDVGTLDNGAPYMVMEYLAGTDFARLLKQRGALPLADAIDFLLQAGEAIAEAHMLGIVHRDLKPANLFLTTHAEGSPLVKVLDFGLSKMTRDEEAVESNLTATTAIVGSPQYMSPEQIRSLKHVGPGTDLWALGVILHEMLTGTRPFEGRTLTAVSASIVADMPPPVRTIRPDLPMGLDAVVLACLEKDASRRVQSVAELAARLAPFAPARSGPSLERIAKLTAIAARPQAPSLSAADADAEQLTQAYVSGPSSHSQLSMALNESAILSVSAAPAAFAPVAPVAPATASAAPAPYPSSVPPPETDANAWGQTKPRVKSRLPAAFAAGGILGLVLLALMGWFVVGRDGPPAPAAATTAPALSVNMGDPQRVPQAPPITTGEPAATTPPAAVVTASPTAGATAAPSATATAHATASPAPRPPATGRPAPPPPRRGGNPLDRSD